MGENKTHCEYSLGNYEVIIHLDYVDQANLIVTMEDGERQKGNQVKWNGT
jgi:hypothetical protein